MANTRRAGKKVKFAPGRDPQASRPVVPAVYGIPKSRKDLLPWSHVEERMAAAKHYWVCTTGTDGQPHATPVDGLWLDGALYFGGDPQTRWNRNLAANPAVCVHLESATDVVILSGRAPHVKADRALAERLAKASAEKYGYGLRPEDYEAAAVCMLRPKKVLAWSRFMRDATRWLLPDPDSGE